MLESTHSKRDEFFHILFSHYKVPRPKKEKDRLIFQLDTLSINYNPDSILQIASFFTDSIKISDNGANAVGIPAVGAVNGANANNKNMNNDEFDGTFDFQPSDSSIITTKTTVCCIKIEKR